MKRIIRRGNAIWAAIGYCKEKYAHNPNLSWWEYCIMQNHLHMRIDYSAMAVHGHRSFRAWDVDNFPCLIAMLTYGASLKQGIRRMGFTVVVLSLNCSSYFFL